MEEREGKKIEKKDNWIEVLVEEECKFEARKCINGGQKSLGVCRRSKRKLGKWKKLLQLQSAAKAFIHSLL